ncbi:MAG: N-acyl homoserine lactonase family protein [Candidatus Dormibacteria bacterium]
MRRLLALSLGEACCDKGSVLTPGHGDGQRIHIPICGFLLLTDGGRRVLIDTGIHRDHVSDPDLTWRGTPTAEVLRPVMRIEDTVDYRLAALGLRGTDITDVVNTHLHFDHAGNNDAFPNATVHVQREQYEVALDNASFPNQYWRLAGVHFDLLDGESDLGDGLSVIPTPGHVPGHQSVLVQLESGQNIVICGDAIYDQDNLGFEAWKGHMDPDQARSSAQILLDKARGLDATVLYGHDRDQWSTVRKAPDYYE